MADKHWGGGDLRAELQKHAERLDKLEKESLKALRAAIVDGFNKVAAAIEKSAAGGLTPEQQAKLDAMKAKLDANDPAVATALEQNKP